MDISLFNKKSEEFLTFLDVEKNCSHHTLRAYKTDLEQLKQFWHHIKKQHAEIPLSFDNIVRRFVHSLFFKKVSTASLARKLSSIKSFAHYLKSQGIEIKINFKAPKIEKKLPTVLTVDEIFYLLDKIKSEDLPTKLPLRDKSIFELLYATGVRCSELVNIKLTDIDFINKSISVLGKGKKDRIVLFGEKAKQTIEKYLQDERRFLGTNNEIENLFLNYYGKQITPRSVQRICEMFRKFLKIDRKLTPHKIRHSFATHLVNQGTDLRVVQELLGHKTLATTEIYTHISSHELAQMCDEKHPLNKMNALILDK